MTHPALPGHCDAANPWFQRRSFLRAAARWAACMGAGGVQAQSRSNIVHLSGQASLNGERLRQWHTIQTGDEIITGAGSSLVFVLGDCALHLRPHSHIVVERGRTMQTVNVLRLHRGGLVSVWAGGTARRILTSQLTIAISARSDTTGIYTEVPDDPNQPQYACTCFGAVDLHVGLERTSSRAQHHQAFWVAPQAASGLKLQAAPTHKHPDAELDALAQLLHLQTAWATSADPNAHLNTNPSAAGTTPDKL